MRLRSWLRRYPGSRLHIPPNPTSSSSSQPIRKRQTLLCYARTHSVYCCGQVWHLLAVWPTHTHTHTHVYILPEIAAGGRARYIRYNNVCANSPPRAIRTTPVSVQYNLACAKQQLGWWWTHVDWGGWVFASRRCRRRLWHVFLVAVDFARQDSILHIQRRGRRVRLHVVHVHTVYSLLCTSLTKRICGVARYAVRIWAHVRPQRHTCLHAIKQKYCVIYACYFFAAPSYSMKYLSKCAL